MPRARPNEIIASAHGNFSSGKPIAGVFSAAAVLPARELLADLLLELKDAGAALTEYEQSLKTDPNRFRSILGKARAAKQAGDLAASRDAYQKLVTLAGPAASERAELSEAKASLTN